MEEKPKRKMTEKQLANLQTDKYKFSKDNPEIAQKNQEKSVIKRKENTEKTIEREISADYGWRKFFGTDEKLEDFWQSLSPKDKKDIFIRLLPPDMQTSKIIGDLGLEKIFITPKEAKETDKHINDFIDDELK